MHQDGIHPLNTGLHRCLSPIFLQWWFMQFQHSKGHWELCLCKFGKAAGSEGNWRLGSTIIICYQRVCKNLIMKPPILPNNFFKGPKENSSWENKIKTNVGEDFPGGPVVKNLPSNAGICGQGTKIPHATGQLSPRTTTTELVRLNERAHTPQLQSPCALEPVRHN